MDVKSRQAADRAADPESRGGKPMHIKMGETIRLAALRAYWDGAPFRSFRAATDGELRELARFVARTDLEFAKRLCNALFVEAKIAKDAINQEHPAQVEAFK